MFIVIGHNERPKKLIQWDDKTKPILMYGSTATFFDTRSQARAAIKRTLRHAEKIKQGKNPAWVEMSILELESAESAGAND